MVYKLLYSEIKAFATVEINIVFLMAKYCDILYSDMVID